MGWLDEDVNVNKASELAEEEAEKQGGGVEILPQVKVSMQTRRITKKEFRKAFSEVALLELMDYKPLEMGVQYNFITAGDVDALSYLKIIMNQHDLDHLIVSTWCMSQRDAEDISTLVLDGRIKAMDFFVGEIMPSGDKAAWRVLKELYEDNPNLGKLIAFRNHAKIFAGYNGEEQFYFGLQSSANINTNPRCEQACLTTDKELYEFYKDYFDKIR